MSTQPDENPIQFTCSHCGASISAPASQAGVVSTCDQCGGRVENPQAAESGEAESPAESPVAEQTPSPPPAIRYRRPVARPLRQAQAKGAGQPLLSRRTMAVISAVVALAVGGLAWFVIARDMKRVRLQEQIEHSLEKGENEFSSGDITGAARCAEEVRKQIAASPLPLDREKIQQWHKQSQRFIDGNEAFLKLQKLMLSAPADPAGVRSHLENKKMLLAGAAEFRPLVIKIDEWVAELVKLEEKNKLERLRADLGQADQLYKSGKIDEAAAKAALLGAELAEKPLVRDGALEARIEILRKRGAQFKDAKDVRLAGGKNYAEARTKLDGQIQSLDAKNEDLRPLADAIAKLKTELADEEQRAQEEKRAQEDKKNRALSTQDAAGLQGLAQALAGLDQNISVKPITDGAIGLDVNGKLLHMGFFKTAAGNRVFMEAGGARFFVDSNALLNPRNMRTFHPLRTVRLAAALGDAMQKAGIKSADYWEASEEAPFPIARRHDPSGKDYVFLGDRLYAGQLAAKTDAQRGAEADFVKKAEALEKAVLNDQPTSKEVRETVAAAAHATCAPPKEDDWFDHLRKEFIRRVIAENYLESIVPEMGKRLQKELADYRAAYEKVGVLVPDFSGSDNNGNLAAELRTAEGFPLWVLYDQASDTTTFALKDPDQDKGCLFVLYDFPGKLSEFPVDGAPRRVRMAHQALGLLAAYDPAAQKMTHDQAAWDQAAALEAFMLRPDYSAYKGFGTPAWAFPPHVLLVDTKQDTKSIVTPYGKLDIQDFNKIAEPGARAKAMEAFLGQMAHVMPTAPYLHLFFRYFLEYVLDSPVPSLPGLIGCRAYTGGNVHQTVYQTLSRFRAGHYLGECADLAELYMNVTRRQNKISYVMMLPKHAACGWVEKSAGDGAYTFYVIDTGPPHLFTDASLDKAAETAYRSYDDTKTMRVDPKGLGFLFRFNNEPRRAPYALSTRMFVDKDYGDTMERVESYWHFHFYALGIKTMTEMIEKGDRVPENYTELAGLYQWAGDAENSVKWTQEALKQLGPNDLSSRFSEEFRIGSVWFEYHNCEKAYAAVKDMAGELKRLENGQDRFNFTSTRLMLMALLENIHRPWEGWDVAARDIQLITARGGLRIEHAAGLTRVYWEMRKLIGEGKQPSAEEQAGMEQLRKILAWFYDQAVFGERDDNYGAILRKYACLGQWYAAKYGQARLVQELLKDGPYPDAAKPRNHRDRRNPEEEDWKWIRLSPVSYALAIGDALNFNEPPEKWRKDEAVKLVDAMIRAEKEAGKFGSLAGEDTEVPVNRATRAFLLKDWKDLEDVLAMMGRENWVRLNSEISNTLGRCARFVAPDEFARLYRMFAKYVKVRTAYFAVIYEAVKGDAIPQALAAAKVALECCPGDEDMVREIKYLEQLAKKKPAGK